MYQTFLQNEMLTQNHFVDIFFKYVLALYNLFLTLTFTFFNINTNTLSSYASLLKHVLQL